MKTEGHDRGFSFLELVVVLGLMSVLMTLAIVGHAALRQRLGLAAAARQVATDFAVARIRAISRNREQRLLFTRGSSSYRIQERASNDFDDLGPRELPVGILIGDCTAPGDVISFRPRGGAGSFGSVVLRDASGETRSITVGITGRARIQ